MLGDLAEWRSSTTGTLMKEEKGPSNEFLTLIFIDVTCVTMTRPDGRLVVMVRECLIQESTIA